MSVLKFPNIKISKRVRQVGKDAEYWYDNGFPWEVAVAAATLASEVERLERRVQRLEGKPPKRRKNSLRHKSKRVRSSVVLLRDNI